LVVLALKAIVDQDLFICPRCTSPVRPEGDLWHCTDASCRYADERFPVVAGIPALVDFEHSVLDAERLRAADGASEVHRSRLYRMRGRLTHPRNTTAPVAVARMLELLRFDDATASRRPRILVIGGGTVGAGLEELYADPTVDLVAFDIYQSPVVQFIADGHAIPLKDGSLDGVVVQAVLEHVLEPSVVAQEIHRVLRSGGVVYADTPFIQQVHEGPYDFTRFTDSGHRYLFRRFERIDSGAVAGAGTALRWSISYFVRALTRSGRLGTIMRLCFFWLSYLDHILDPEYSIDGASSVFFLGRKTAISITQAEIIDYYQGGHFSRGFRRHSTRDRPTA
jgi:SAM-dependent methyltransferase